MSKNTASKAKSPQGRPHAGLSNPSKFGLTYEEVVKLIENDRWLAFYRNWWKKNNKRPHINAPISRRRKTTFNCTCCKKRYSLKEKHLCIKGVIRICIRCTSLLKGL
jgi:hypothetical protein